MKNVSNSNLTLSWVQWGRRHYYMGPLGLQNKLNIEIYVSHLFPKIPESLKNYSKTYRLDFVQERVERKIGINRDNALDYEDTTLLDSFHRKVLREFNKTDILYTLANGYEIMSNVDSAIKIHDQVACHLTLAEIANKYKNKKINLDLLRDKEIKLFNSVDLVICPSENVRDYVNQLSPKTKTSIVRFPVREIRNIVSRKININNLNALFVGRIEPAKGFATIIDLAKLNPKINFHCVGMVLQKLENIPPNMKLYGNVPHCKINEYYEKADLLLFPSLSEGSATVTQEAMAYGLPGIVSYQSGSHYTDSYSGYVVDAYDTERFDQCLKRLDADRDLLSTFREAVCKDILIYTMFNYHEAHYKSITSVLPDRYK